MGKNTRKQQKQPSLWENISELERTDYDYFCHVARQLQDNEFEDADDKKLFINNVVQATDGHEVQLCCHGQLSHTVELLLREASPSNLLRFLNAVSQDDHCLMHLSTHQNASHVLQTLLEICSNQISNKNDKGKTPLDDEKEESADPSRFVEWVLRFSTFVVPNLETFFKNVYACHVLCSLLETLSGCKVSGSIHKSKKSQRQNFTQLSSNAPAAQVPGDFQVQLGALLKAIKKLPNLSDVITDTSSATVIQTALLVSSKSTVEKAPKLINILAEKMLTDDRANLLDSKHSHMIERIVQAANESEYVSLMEYFRGKLGGLVRGRNSNYIVQQFIRCCPSQTEFQKIFEELSTEWNVAEDAGHLGVFVAISEACVKLGGCQAAFVEQLSKLMGCFEPKEGRTSLALLTATWSKYGEISQGKINYYGSVLIQNMLRFQRPALVVNGLLQCEWLSLKSLLCDPSGSHVLDAFVTSPTVGEKNRQKLVATLKGHLFDLAKDKFGSRCVEMLWKSVSVNVRATMADELVDVDSRLRSDQYGVYVYNLCALPLYKNRPEEWMQLQSTNTKKRKLFRDILESTSRKRKI